MLKQLLLGIAVVVGTVRVELICSPSCTSSEACVCDNVKCECRASIDDIANCVTNDSKETGVTIVCFERGVCIDNTCQCRDNYDPQTTCRTCRQGYMDVGGQCVDDRCVCVVDNRITECNNHGACVTDEAGESTCRCHNDFTLLGTNICTHKTCIVDRETIPAMVVGNPDLPCAGLGKCIASGCICNQGYSRPYCASCAPTFVPAVRAGFSRVSFPQAGTRSAQNLACISVTCIAVDAFENGMPVECSGVGICRYSSDTRQYSCSCNSGYLSYRNGCYNENCFTYAGDNSPSVCNNAGTCVSGTCKCWGTHKGTLCTECNTEKTVSVDDTCLAKACITASGTSPSGYALCGNKGQCIYTIDYKDKECLCDPVNGDKVDETLNSKCEPVSRQRARTWLYITAIASTLGCVGLLFIILFFAIKQCRYKYVAKHRAREYDPTLLNYF